MKQESNRQKTMEDIDGGLHPAVDGQSQGEGEGEARDNLACVANGDCDAAYGQIMTPVHFDDNTPVETAYGQIMTLIYIDDNTPVDSLRADHDTSIL